VVTLTGLHLAGTNQVSFAGNAAALFTAVSDTELSAIVPGAGQALNRQPGRGLAVFTGTVGLVLGTVATFNLFVILSPALAAYAAFAFARAAVRDDGAAWVAGVAFGFAPFMSARALEHFSLLQTAPVVLFAFAKTSRVMLPAFAPAGSNAANRVHINTFFIIPPGSR